jgi:uncharacterized protein (DUF58 family)
MIRPAPLELDADFLQRCELLHVTAQRTWGRQFLARKEERRLAGGTEVTSFSDYTCGNDYRYVDWNRCARHDELLSKQFQGNEDQYVYFLIDCSGSMQIIDGTKFAAAARLTAALGYLALANLDRVGVTAFADGVLADLPPVRGRRHVPRLFEFLRGLPRAAASTDLRRVAAALVRRPQPPGLTVIVSDMLDPSGFEPALDILRRCRFEPYVLQVYHPFDAQPQLLGKFRLVDAETGRTQLRVIDEQDLANYRDVWQEHGESLRRYCYHYSLGLTQTRSDVPLERSLETIMLRAARR